MKALLITLLFLVPVFAQTQSVENLKTTEKSKFSPSSIYAKVDKNALTLKEKSGFTTTKLNVDIKKGLSANKVNIEAFSTGKFQGLANASKKGFSGTNRIAVIDKNKAKGLKANKNNLKKESFNKSDAPGLLKSK